MAHTLSCLMNHQNSHFLKQHVISNVSLPLYFVMISYTIRRWPCPCLGLPLQSCLTCMMPGRVIGTNLQCHVLKLTAHWQNCQRPDTDTTPKMYLTVRTDLAIFNFGGYPDE